MNHKILGTLQHQKDITCLYQEQDNPMPTLRPSHDQDTEDSYLPKRVSLGHVIVNKSQEYT